MSIDYYNENGAVFFAGSVNADMTAVHRRFLAHLPRGGAILDAGCGSGRDSLAFKNGGYAVTAFDGSREMVRLARTHTGLPVHHLLFDDVAWPETFDGIWACASLLHVARENMGTTLARLARTLKPTGTWFMSFKYGDTDRVVAGRHFTDMTEVALSALMEQNGLPIVDMWVSPDVRPDGTRGRWLSVIVKKY